MRMALIAAVVMLFTACADSMPTEVQTDAQFGVGNAPALTVSDFAVDQPAASYLDPLNLTATVQVGHLRGNEYVRVRFTLGPIYVFRDGTNCRDNGYPSGAYCVLSVGLCEVGDNWSTRVLEFDAPGTYEVAVPLNAGVLCDGLVVAPADYQIGLVSGIFNHKSERKYRSIGNDYANLELTD